jgi:hypothetical protein
MVARNLRAKYDPQVLPMAAPDLSTAAQDRPEAGRWTTRRNV